MVISSTVPRLILLLYCCTSRSIAFVAPHSFASSIQSYTGVHASFCAPLSAPSLMMLGAINVDNIMADVHSNVQAVTSSITTSSPHLSYTSSSSSLQASLPSSQLLADGGIGETIATIVSVIAIIIFGFGALTLVMANIIIPKAAEELEAKAKREYPELWADTQAKLEEGEILAMRPDLIQDLGRLVQERDVTKFEAMAVVDEEESSTSSNVVDVEVITESKEETK